jgi:NmrA-like family
VWTSIAPQKIEKLEIRIDGTLFTNHDSASKIKMRIWHLPTETPSGRYGYISMECGPQGITQQHFQFYSAPDTPPNHPATYTHLFHISLHNLQMAAKRILVVGGTGAQGGAVVEALLAADPPFKVRVLSRDPENEHVKEKFPPESGVELVKGSFTDIESVRLALEDCYGLFLNTDGKDLPTINGHPSKVVLIPLRDKASPLRCQMRSSPPLESGRSPSGFPRFVISCGAASTII